MLAFLVLVLFAVVLVGAAVVSWVAVSPRAKAPYAAGSESLGFLVYNDQANALEAGPTLSVLDRDTNAQPGSPTDGDSYQVGPSPTGAAWSGNAKKHAIYRGGGLTSTPDGWIIRDFVAGEVVGIVDEKLVGFAESGGGVDLRPLNAPMDPGTERDTGMRSALGAGLVVYRKLVRCAGLPNTTSGTFAHGITDLDVGKTSNLVLVRATMSNGTTIRALPWHDGTNLATVEVDATNITVTTNFDASGWDGLVEIVYVKTS